MMCSVAARGEERVRIEERGSSAMELNQLRASLSGSQAVKASKGENP